MGGFFWYTKGKEIKIKDVYSNITLNKVYKIIHTKTEIQQSKIILSNNKQKQKKCTLNWSELAFSKCILFDIACLINLDVYLLLV